VIRSLDPAGGGAAEWVVRLGVEQTKAGQHAEVATLDDPGAEWLKGVPFPVHALGPVATTYGLTPRLVPWLQQHCRSYDVVIAHGLWQYTSLAVWRVLKAAGRPYFVFPQGMLDPWFKRRYRLKHLKKWLYWPWAEYRVLRDATAVLFTADEERRLARRSFWLYRCTERIVHLGTTAPPDQESVRGRWFTEAFPETAGKRVVLFLGRIHEKKGCDLLVRAFAAATKAALPSERPWHLVFAGPFSTPAYEHRMKRLVREAGLADSVTWTGMLAGDTKWSAFRAADVFILPSHQENFGVAVAEALACGLPALISDKVNIWREVTAADAGFAEADDVNGTGRLLDRWMALDDVSRDRMRANAIGCFGASFDARDAAVRLDTVLEEFLP
jgi:glycosyltransferase involved in cell wall biosynthesis